DPLQLQYIKVVLGYNSAALVKFAVPAQQPAFVLHRIVPRIRLEAVMLESESRGMYRVNAFISLGSRAQVAMENRQHIIPLRQHGHVGGGDSLAIGSGCRRNTSLGTSLRIRGYGLPVRLRNP